MKLLKIGLFITSLLTVSAVFSDEIITIAASPVPHAEILKQIKPILKKEGIDLQIKEFNDYVLPNLAVAQGKMDANFFQHRPYLAQFNKDKGTNLVELVGVEIEPMGIYIGSEAKLKDFAKSKSVAKLPKGLKVAIPNDTTNEGRSLLLLQKHGLIKVKSDVKYPTKNDIISNPYQLKFVELEAAMLPRVLSGKQVDIAVINSNYALDANLLPTKDAVFIEDSTSPYVNIIAVRPTELNEPKMKKLAQALHSKSLKSYIDKQYKGAVIPTF
ncbi:MAG: MetQ/NlpA family ABC transporter substrate-binding protein [Neisseriaceae bacterium]